MSISRTKTTGDDKAVKARPLVIGRGACVKWVGWFTTGWELLKAHSTMPRKFLMCEPDSELVCNRNPLGYTEYSGRLRAVWSELTDEQGHTVGSEATVHFTPHSMRSFLISGASGLGAPRESLRWLQGWNAQGGEGYVRTCGTETMRAQDVVGFAARELFEGEDPFGEGLDLEELKEFLLKRGVAPL